MVRVLNFHRHRVDFSVELSARIRLKDDYYVRTLSAFTTAVFIRRTPINTYTEGLGVFGNFEKKNDN